jgi:hypothetical protein
MRDLIGRTLGHYRIVDKIGEGGMGEVYRAHDERLDRDVAVKVLPGSVAQDPERIARFEREAKAVAKLEHPNILAIYDFGTDEGVTYSVTEFLEGETLRERLEDGELAWRKTAEIGARGGDHPPRPQARQRLPHLRWTGEDPRLRAGPGCGGRRT